MCCKPLAFAPLGTTQTNFYHQMTNNLVSYSFPGSSAGKKSTCNAGDPCLIPWSGRSPGKGIGYILQYSWVSLVAQVVKNLLAVCET